MSRRWLRDLGSFAVILAVVAVFALVALLTRRPDSPLLESAQRWPLVGPLAREFRERYLRPAPRRPREAVTGDFFELDLRSRGRDEEEGGFRWTENFKPWHGHGAPPLGSSPQPPLPLPGREADQEHLAEALRHLQEGSASGLRLGPYALLTDVGDAVLLEKLSEVASGVESFYVERYGVETRGSARETVVLYRSEKDYRALQRRSDRIGSLDSQGHSGYGLVALFVGSLRAEDVAHSLLHELTHLLNRRALGPALPPWLGEGIADDVASARPDATGGLVQGELRMAGVEIEGRITLRGPLAGLGLLARSQREGSLGPLSSLIELEWEPFVAEPRAGLYYAHSAFFVRYLLSEESGIATAFRLFLADVALGKGVAAAELEKRLGKTLDQVEAGWRRYLEGQIVEAGLLG